VIGGDEGAVPEPGLPTPVAPPMTPPVVGGFAAPVAVLAGGGGVPEPAELFVAALFVGAPPPTAPAGAPRTTAAPATLSESKPNLQHQTKERGKANV
jgi:hypothetical protein